MPDKHANKGKIFFYPKYLFLASNGAMLLLKPIVYKFNNYFKKAKAIFQWNKSGHRLIHQAN